MARGLNLANDSLRRLYLTYLGASVFGTLVASLYILADTILIGRTLGSTGLAALDLALPIYNIFSAVGLLLGVGAATVYGVSGGRNRQAVSLALAWGLFCSALSLIAGWFFLTEIVSLLGASATLVSYTREYAGILLVSGPFFIFAALLAPLVSIDGAPRLPMWALIAGSLVNLALDLLFIFSFNWGMKGAALATGLAAGVNFLILLSHFFSPRCKISLTLKQAKIKETASLAINGFPSFITELTAGAALLLFNQALLRQVGAVGVAAYGIIINIAIVCSSVFFGVGQAIHPLISFNYGAGKWKRVVKVRNAGLLTALFTSLSLFFLGQVFSRQIVGAFLTSEGELARLAASGLRIYSWAFLPMSLNVALGSYFQAMEFADYAISIALARGGLFILLGLLILPSFFGVTGVWLVLPCAEVLALCLSVYLAFS